MCSTAQPRPCCSPACWLVVGLALAVVIGPSRPLAAQDSKPAAEKPAESKPAEDKPDPEEEREKVEKERRDLARKKARTERDIEMAKLRLERARLAIELAERSNAQSLAKSKAELELAQRKLKTFKERNKPERINRAELSFQWSQDNAREAQQELEQLEMMYKEDEFADKTKEIVLERGKRRLERSQRSLAIETEAIATLKGETLPVEEAEQELSVREKTESLERMVRDQHAGMIDLRVGLMGAEAEVIRLQEELEDVVRDIASFERKQAKAEKEKAEKAATRKSNG